MTTRNSTILVGVDRFNDQTFASLRFCKNDLEAMARVLGNADICDFEVVALHNGTRDEILEALERTTQSLTPGDKFLFYFAGHGRRSPQSGRLYLIANNTKADSLRATGVPIDDVLNIIRESRCTNRAIVLDCCHSGAIGQEFCGGDLSPAFAELARNSGIYILTASTAIELAAEREVEAVGGVTGNGIFTKYFVEGLETGNASSDENGLITIDSIYDYVQQNITGLAPQIPQRFVIGGAGNFVVGRSSGAQWQRRRVELSSHLLTLYNNNVISDDDYVKSMRLCRTTWSTLTPTQKECARAGLEVIDNKSPVTQFLSRVSILSGEPSRTDPARVTTESQPSDKLAWKAEFAKRSSNLFLIRIWSLSESHYLDINLAVSHMKEELMLDGIVLQSFWIPGKKSVDFTQLENIPINLESNFMEP
jgi:hypothetical protein